MIGYCCSGHMLNSNLSHHPITGEFCEMKQDIIYVMLHDILSSNMFFTISYLFLMLILYIFKKNKQHHLSLYHSHTNTILYVVLVLYSFKSQSYGKTMNTHQCNMMGLA